MHKHFNKNFPIRFNFIFTPLSFIRKRHIPDQTLTAIIIFPNTQPHDVKYLFSMFLSSFFYHFLSQEFFIIR